MQYEWLEEGIRHGGSMSVSYDGHLIMASLHWSHPNQKICGDPQRSLQEAILSLNKALHQDALKTIGSVEWA